MNKDYLQPVKLDYYSFVWSEVRLVIAAVALFLGGVPPIWLLLPVSGLFGAVGALLTLSWIISGVASAYLLYRWITGGKRLFGHTEQRDTIAFLISVVSGLNLGLVGVLGRNIGMSILSGRVIFLVVGIIYLTTAGYLYSRWNSAGRKVF